MKITNRYNLPFPIVSAISQGIREPRKGQISITTLIDAPLIRVLREKHWDEMTEDASDRIWALLGTTVHAVLEKADTSNHLSEEKLTAEVCGYTITGIPDLLDGEGTLHDYKITSVYSFLLGDKESWTNQVNSYAHLYRLHGFEVKKAQIVAILRDWVKSKAHEPDYPKCPVLVKEVPLWSPSVVKAYIQERVALHNLADRGVIAPCTAEERWERPTTYAVMKKGQKRAVRVLDTLDDAQIYYDNLPKKDDYSVQERPGSSIRCSDYCQVREFCEYALSLKKEG